MKKLRARLIIVSRLERVTVCDQGAIKRSIPGKNYSYAYNVDSDTVYPTLRRFPLVLNVDGSPWKEANLYLIGRYDSSFRNVDATYLSIAYDLLHYRRFLDEESIDFLQFPQKALYRPTYRFRAYLENELNSGSIAVSRARRVMSRVIDFYRWLKSEDGLQLDHEPWRESDISIRLATANRSTTTKTAKRTDLSVRYHTSNASRIDYIADEGKLRPLPQNEQLALLTALSKSQNTEMRLIFLIALLTGARLQSILTLRTYSLPKVVDGKTDAPILMGAGTGIDTKYNKKLILYFPYELNKYLNIYANSFRAQARRNKAIGKVGVDYLFLSRIGNPYYIARDDIHASSQRSVSRGGSVREFLRTELRPLLDFDFRFHDLRATFAMNLVERQMQLVERKICTLHHVRLNVKDRLGQASLSTTDRYMDHRRLQQITLAVQDEFEKQIMMRAGVPIED